MKHEQLLNWWCHKPKDGPPAWWGDPRLYEYRSSSGRWYCRLCWRNADDAHVRSRGHAKNVRWHVYVTPPRAPGAPSNPGAPSAWALESTVVFRTRAPLLPLAWDGAGVVGLARGRPPGACARWGHSRRPPCPLGSCLERAVPATVLLEPGHEGDSLGSLGRGCPSEQRSDSVRQRRPWRRS